MSQLKKHVKKNNLAERLRQAREQLQDIREENSIQAEPENHSKEPLNDVRVIEHTDPPLKKTSIAKNPKLFVAGRFNRKAHSYTSKAFYILDDLDEDIKAHCKGTDVTVYNFLISLGLEYVKGLTELKSCDVSEIEQKYSAKQIQEI